MELCVNNSWSGSCIFSTRSGTVGAYVDRAVQLHNDKTGEEPDIIAVYLGTNDFTNYKSTLGTAATVDYGKLITENGDGTFSYAAPVTACEAYAIMLHKAAVRYPDAEVYCFTLLPRLNQSSANIQLAEQFNASIEAIAEHFGAAVVDLYNESGIKADGNFAHYVADSSLHPGPYGMDALTGCFLSALYENSAYNADEVYGISYELDEVIITEGTAYAIAEGRKFECSLKYPSGYEAAVSVKMGGKDITAEVYADGKISISSVTGDIEISAKAKMPEKDPENYRFEFNGTELVNTTENGFDANALTRLAGSVANGVHSKSRFRLEKTVILYHDRPWTVEWKSEGTWLDAAYGALLFSGTEKSSAADNMYIYRRNNSDFIAMGVYSGGNYHNYGVKLSENGINATVEHVYCLENRIAYDGSNMVYLLVDGREIGALNHYWIGGTDQKKESDWISGKDFVFGYMGTDPHTIGNCSIDYVAVWENGHEHTYKGASCSTCGLEHPNAANYEGKVFSVLGDSISTFAGYIPTADGFNLEHLARYPQDNLLTDVNETWWMQVVAELGGKLGINDSWRGSTVSGYPSVTTGVAGYLAAMSNTTQIQNLGSNGTPDVIMFYGGTNDLAHTPNLGSFDPATAPTEVDLETLKWDNLADAYCHTILRLRHFHPDSEIIAMFPTYTASYYTNSKLAQGNAILREICEHYGVKYIDLRDCGISVSDLPDGIHPDAKGMDYITDAVLGILLDECETEAGENIVYSVTHNLENAKADKHYYKGASAGNPFSEMLSGENLSVSVTMGGKDITAEAYKDGKISIASVSGDIVITAAGEKVPVYAEYIQELPEDYYGKNLWKILEHNEEYYTASGWGIHSSGNVRSVTFGVKAGEKIFASSFGKAGENGTASANGIRVTFFDESDVLVSMSADKVYAEFAEKGYITVPENAKAVNVPMWTDSADWELYLYDSSYEPEFSLGEHLQALPEKFCAGTNLWTALEPENKYYTGSEWGNVSGNAVYSITVPVTENDRISATSFGKSGENGGSRNGIRVTWFGKDGVLESVGPDAVYAEFSANGYLTAPEGAVAVNVPMWNGNDSNELYILSAEHEYKGVSCSICGSKHPNTENYEGKIISIMGDSISTFAGYIPTADGFNLEHKTRYPQDNLLTDVNETWWMQVLNMLDAKLGINESWASSEVYNYIDAEVNSTSDGTKACMASVTRIQNMGSNGTPDVILFFGGTNDITQSRPIGTFSSETAPAEVDLVSVKWESVADAYVTAIMRMQYYYPDAEIIAVLPFYRNSQGKEKVNSYNALFAEICEHYGVPYADLRDCGITNANLPDGTHPEEEGMDYITDAVLEVMTGVEIGAGESVVYSVTHELENAKASLGYYKGISAGKAFAETLEGENLSVKVTMGGVDITETAYKDGKISIASATGDIVVTATGKKPHLYADRLQALPEKFCAGTDLWKVLEPENIYFRNGGWGINATGLAHSVTVPISAGDRILATSFGESGSNGGTKNGIALTWFGEERVIETFTPEKTYAEFAANGYLTAPEGAAAVNVVMWNGDETNEFYILSAEHEYSSVVTEPTCKEQGFTTYTCGICGENYVGDYVESSGEHKYDDGVCIWCGTSKLGKDWLVPEFAEGDYSMVVLPDTQNMITYHAEHYYNMMRWIADNAEEMNIRGVMHMGDMVNNNNDTEWTICKNGTDIIEAAGIPWMPMMGNHDNSAWFNKYYDYKTFGTEQSWFGGAYHADKLDHTYWFVTAGGREYLILSLGWAPSWDVLDWAKGVVEENSDKNVIINCHAYMDKDGTFLSKGDAHCVSSYLSGYPDGDDVWNAFAEYENVVLAMGGHISTPDIVTRTDKNGINRDVYSMLIDAQNEDVQNKLGMIAVLTFREDSDKVDVNWYGTRYDALYGAENQFEITVPHLCEHDFEVTEKEATCTEAGGKYYLCRICGGNYTEGETEVPGHDYKEIVTEPTCTETGYTELVCERCGHSEMKKSMTDISGRFSWTDGQMIQATSGKVLSDANWMASDYTDISDFDFIEIKTANTATKNSTIGLAFYDANKNYISGVVHTDKSGVYGILIHELEVPENAVYIRSTYYSKNHASYKEEFGEFYCRTEAEEIIPATGHSYKGASCEACGAEHPNAANYEGKVISILSASTSTFAGYIPVADGFNLEHRARYPQDNLLTDVNETWWMQVINELDAKLGINESWAGSQVLNTQDNNSGDLGPDAAMASVTRIRNVGANGTPDVIFFFGAGNDMGRGVAPGNFDPAAAPTEVDLVTKKWDNLADAYAAAIMRLQYFYPDAEIVVMTTYAMPGYVTAAKLNKYAPVLNAICDHYGVKYVDLRNAGVTFDMLPDDVHPNAEGMDHITEAVLDFVLNEYETEPGENVVYSVTHELTGAKAEKHYYKGVSAGKTFEETVSGEELSVKVTMGGRDITAEAYKDGKISISSVSGDIVITATGKYNCDGHLQELPEELCAGTNLWTALEPENIYYTASGWGNLAGGTSWSITFPVNEGERIFATSFGAYPGNGSTANGTRITWFSETGVLESVARDVVYKEFAANGYITVPKGAVAVNIPHGSNNSKFEVYLLDREHSYENGICTVCGEWKYSIGDINLDGEVNVKDAYYARLVAAKLIKPTGEQLLVGDVDLDGRITALDANIIRKFVAKIIETLPVTG